MSKPSEIQCEKRGAAGLVTLDRPAALNALTHDMVRELAGALEGWARDPTVTRVIVRGAGERAFCAGGDIRTLYDLCKAGRFEETSAFWRDEYRLNIAIKSYPKPYIALIDGIVMGGGVGVSLHGSHRIAGGRYLFAMPEVGIGFFPDVGATFALPRLPRHAGHYIALTGERLKAADAVALGLADAHVPSERLAELSEALFAGEPIDAAISALKADPGHAPILDMLPLIERCFSAESLPAVLARLDEAAASGAAAAQRMAAGMRAKSPTSLAIAFEQMRRGGGLNFAEAMALEFRIVSRIARAGDFPEGVRAVLIDKDQKPVWRPATIEALDANAIAAYFAPLPDGELPIPAGGTAI